MLWALLLLFLGPARALPLETDIPYMGNGTITLGTHTLRLEGRQIIGPTLLADQLYTAPVGNGKWLCAADEGDGLGRLRCWDSQLQSYTLMTGGRPNRLSLSADMLAWTASYKGLPAVFVASTNGAIPPRALTNVDLAYTPGQRPAGFVPPPIGNTLRFEGDYLRWNSPEGPQAVRWR